MTPVWRWWAPLLAAALAGLWGKTVATVYANEGVFVWLGVDFRAYYTQASILRDGLADRLYDLDTVNRYTDLFQPFAVALGPLDTIIVPYPPAFAGLMLPLTWLPPVAAFGLWTLVNWVAGLHLARQIAAVSPPGWGRRAALLFLVSFPVGYSLFLGQPMVLLAGAVAECALALRAGRELRAGVWLGLLLFKPQYGVLIGALLLWKRRWRTVAGVALTAAGLLMASLLAAGRSGLLAYPEALVADRILADDAYLSFPQDMVNWRMVALRLGTETGPWLSEDGQFAFSMAASGLTAVVVLAAWRGPWRADDAGFPARMSLLWLGTVLATYHSHAEGPILAALPLAAMFAGARSPRLLGWSVLTVLVIPTVLMLVLRAWFIQILMVQLLVLFGAVALECRAHRAGAVWADRWPSWTVLGGPSGSLLRRVGRAEADAIGSES